MIQQPISLIIQQTFSSTFPPFLLLFWAKRKQNGSSPYLFVMSTKKKRQFAVLRTRQYSPPNRPLFFLITLPLLLKLLQNLRLTLFFRKFSLVIVSSSASRSISSYPMVLPCRSVIQKRKLIIMFSLSFILSSFSCVTSLFLFPLFDTPIHEMLSLLADLFCKVDVLLFGMQILCTYSPSN